MKTGKSCYVEIDPYCAAWLRNLISGGVITPGDVANCDIRDICPADLAGYSQVHLYAGIGVHSYALRRAGIPDSANVWTFSEPCQPFSAAGKGLGFADERYLRPYTNHLIEQCRPAICLGEQVASNDGLGWLDIVQADMERARYAGGALDTCSAGFGAPHIRQRLRLAYVAEEWLANATGAGQLGRRPGETSDGGGSARFEPQRLCHVGILGDAERAGLEGHGGNGDDGDQSGRLGALTYGHAAAPGGVGSLADSDCDQPRAGCGNIGQMRGLSEEERQSEHGAAISRGSSGFVGLADAIGGQLPQPIGRAQGRDGDGSDRPDHPNLSRIERPGPTNGFWSACDWLYCRDGKWRPVEPGTFPLAHGASSRVGRLRAYGNAVDAEATTAFYQEVGELLGLV